VEADSVPAALLQAQSSGEPVTHIREEAPRSPAPRVTEFELATFYRQLASMVRAGLPLAEGLQVLARDSTNASLREVCYTLYVTLANGEPLAAGLEKFPTLFPRLHLALARAGERAGLLPVTLSHTADYLEHVGGLNRRLSSALVYPAVIGTIVVGLLATYWGSGLIAQILSIYGDLGVEQHLPYPTRLVISFSRAALPVLAATLVTAGAVTLILRAYYRTRRGRYRLDRAKLRLPFMGQIVSKGAVARFCRTLGLLLGHGVEVESALTLAGEASGNAVIGRAVQGAAGAVMEGQPLAPSLAASGVLPAQVTDQVAAGEESGTLLTMLDGLAEFHEAQAEHLTRAFSAVIEPLLILVLGLVVGISIISLMLPLVQIVASLSSGGME
jgi:type IV pilus assembly protein PilC